MDQTEKTKLRLIGWICERLAQQDHHCLTGDCEHSQQWECNERLLGDFDRADALNGKAHKAMTGRRASD